MDRDTEMAARYSDRRSALRQTSRVENLIIEHATIGPVSAIVLDLSREGFRLLLPTSVPCGDEIIIHPPAGMDLLKIRGYVVRQSLTFRDGVKMIECGVEVADTAAWRKHNWFLALRTSSLDHEAATLDAEAESAA